MMGDNNITVHMTDLQSSKTFKIRKTLRLQRTQEAQEQEEVANLKDLRLKDSQNLQGRPQQAQNWGTSWIHSEDQGQILPPKEYQNDEEELNCFRFPHSSFCGCQSNCLIENFDAHEVSPGLYFGGFASGLKVKSLLQLGVTHVLNVTSKEYTKRHKYFQYLSIDLHNNTEEDVKKFYRITNRFIRGALSSRGKVFIHASDLQLAAVVAMGYLIGVAKIPMKQSLQCVLTGKLEIAPHFMKQIQSYDLEKMAFVSLTRE